MEEDLSPIEKPFWEAAQSVIPGIRAQCWIGPTAFRVDFLVEEKRLIIEVDGHEWHSNREQRERDNLRTRELTKLGYRVIRFTGSEIHRDVATCVAEAKSVCDSLPFHQPSEEPTPEYYTCRRMQETATHLLDRYGMDIGNTDVVLELKMKDYDNLVIQREGDEIGVLHYFKVGPKHFFDPLIGFFAVRDGNGYEDWVPISLVNPFKGQKCGEHNTKGNLVIYDRDNQGSIAAFAEDWARHIRINGWFDHAERVP